MIPHTSVEEVLKIHLIRTRLVTVRWRHYAVAPAQRLLRAIVRLILSTPEDSNQRPRLLDWRYRGAVGVASLLALAGCSMDAHARAESRPAEVYDPSALGNAHWEPSGIRAYPDSANGVVCYVFRDVLSCVPLSASPRRANRGTL